MSGRSRVDEGRAGAATLPAVFVVGLTGGIGSGKTTASAGLARRGAVVLDADLVAREIVAPGEPALAALVEQFGPGVVGPDGRLDRAAVAELVFSDPEALATLNRITHPEIIRVLRERIAAYQDTASIVVVDVPLLTPETAVQYGLQDIIAVEVPGDVAVARLVAHRGFSERDARARIAAQATTETRRRMASRVLDNSGDQATLERRLDEVWDWLTARAARG